VTYGSAVAWLVVLLPPSEGKTDGGAREIPWEPARTKVPGAAGRRLAGMRTDVTDALARAGGGDAKMLGVGGAHLARATAANARLRGAPTLPAWRRYSGVVWENLDLPSLAAADRRRALGAVWVVSGLAGLVRADEALPDYRLKMGARLAPLGTLSRWWQPAVTGALAGVARRAHVVDLLPAEHRAAIDWRALADAGIAVTRVELRARTGPAGGHFAKAAKGVFARHLLASLPAIDSAGEVASTVPRLVRGFRHATHAARIVS